jgi:hypothetical protein
MYNLYKRIWSSKSLSHLSLMAGLSLLVLVAAACGPASAAPESAPEAEQADLRPVVVEHVGFQVGVGSPIPVDIVASGTWPDLCAQLAGLHQSVDGFQIQIDLWATPENPNCPPDHLGVPFRMAIPLNPVELPAGTYEVSVNGVSNSFDWPPSR